jgi:hypothetical protein
LGNVEIAMPKYADLAGSCTLPLEVDNSKPEPDLASAKILSSLAGQVESKYDSATTPIFGGDIIAPASRLEMGVDPKLSAPGSYETAVSNGIQADSTRRSAPSHSYSQEPRFAFDAKDKRSDSKDPGAQ